MLLAALDGTPQAPAVARQADNSGTHPKPPALEDASLCTQLSTYPG